MYYSYQWLKDLMRAVQSLPPAPTTEMIDRCVMPLNGPGIAETVQIGLDRMHEMLETQFPAVREVNTPGTAAAFLVKTKGAMQALEKAVYED